MFSVDRANNPDEYEDMYSTVQKIVIGKYDEIRKFALVLRRFYSNVPTHIHVDSFVINSKFMRVYIGVDK